MAADGGKQSEKDDSKNDAEKPKANSGKKATGKKEAATARVPRAKKEKKPPTEGTRKSTRVGVKRNAPDEHEEEAEPKEKAPAKKSKTAKK